tara:strand:+ start:435 stop:821 length:387 start_codon:yes stop_codon:yes gene_type:complete
MYYQYTSYKYKRPELLSENEYQIIKYNLNSDPSFYPFNSNSFLDKYKFIFMIYGISIVLGFLVTIIDNETLNIIAGIIGFILFIGSFSLVPEIISYAIVMLRRRIYYKRLVSKIIKSRDYDHLKELMK